MKRLTYRTPQTQTLRIESATHTMLLGSGTAPEPGKQNHVLF
jgi:hypothetical protein